MTQNPYSPQDEQQTDAQPMNFYPAPGSFPAQADAKPAWPTVVGIISLCIAGLVGLGAIVGPIFQAVAEGFQTSQQREMMATMPDWNQTYQWVSRLIWLATSVLLAIGGIMLLKRRRLGRTLHVAYALIGIVLAIAGTAIAVVMMNQMTMPANLPGHMHSFMKTSMLVGAIIGLPFALAYPVFLLIWFGRAKVKQHIQTWQD